MFTTELTVDPKPAPAGYRREFYLTALIMVFTMVQIWAFMVVLTTVHPSGPALLAMALTLAGAVVTMVNGWRYILRRSRTHIDHLSRI
jgi:membrane protein implicated in regulation of membrane protease activity